MRNLILVFVAMLFSTMTFAQSSVQKGATMKFEKTTVDYGTIAQNSNKFRTVNFTNTGTEPLIIKSAKGSCGCTIPTYPETPVAPGSTSEIKIKYDTNRVGTFNKTITFQTNAGVKILKVVGKVEQKASIPTGKSGSILDQK